MDVYSGIPGPVVQSSFQVDPIINTVFPQVPVIGAYLQYIISYNGATTTNPDGSQMLNPDSSTVVNPT